MHFAFCLDIGISGVLLGLPDHSLTVCTFYGFLAGSRQQTFTRNISQSLFSSKSRLGE